MTEGVVADDGPAPAPTDEPTVSVIALCFNHARFVVACLDSIAAQTRRDFELIVTDDASRDGSGAIIAEWLAANRPDATFIRHETNRGVCRTLNEALAIARGRYVSMVATDDLWEPDKLAIQVPEMDRLPDSVAVLYSDAYEVTEDGVRRPGLFIPNHRRFDAPPVGRVFAEMATRNWIPAMTTLVRRSVYATVGPYDEHLAYEDYDMWLRLSRAFDFAFSSYVSATYRIVGTSLIRALHGRNRPALVRTECRIRAKVLESGGLDPAAADRYRDDLLGFAREMNELMGRGAVGVAWLAVRHGRPRAAVPLALSAVHIRGNRGRDRAARVTRQIGLLGQPRRVVRGLMRRLGRRAR